MATSKEGAAGIPTPDADGAVSLTDVVSGPSGSGDDFLVVDGNTTLSLAREDLVVTRPLSKPSRTCGGVCATSVFPTKNPQSESIPLYNILWAELTPSTLNITYAKPLSATKLRPATLSFTLHPDHAPAAGPFTTNLLSLAYGPAKPLKRALVLVNPHAGPGQADRLWDHEARPIFEAARMPLTITRTTHSGQATEIARAVDIDAYDTIVACSGDGLPHEVFNGLGSRADARRALASVAVSHIPCGSGNGMSCNLYGSHRASLAALAIVKGVEVPVDLVSVTQPGGKRYLSFLSQCLGIVAESDLATEHLRWMGESRFTVGFLTRIFKRKVYPADLAIKVEVADKEGVREHYRRARGAALAGGDLDAVSAEVEGKVGGGGDAKVGALVDVEVEGAGSSGSSVANEDGLPPLKYGTVEDKIPEGWEVVSDDKLGNFYAGNMAYMAPDANFFPATLPSDGLIDLVTIDGDISPMSAVSLLLSVESGGFFDNPLVSYRKVSAFRITPRDQDSGYISIDGERVPFEPLQAEVHRGLGRVISKRSLFEAPGPRGWEGRA
ncbi:related to sphingolipid long chain base kinase [Cephalotrichum gorgonifer]|uniref:Related to sphingolipid long chain base kinase n=1 Tax=Cephalotrichum gorgonifer TaxID=2041049 RepID=A0AAE8N0E4_9PEZI|nr:related to sphingolipid long chain base kinase [Cephalotrichum gorgonifer]